jgi:hypothetical protein
VHREAVCHLARAGSTVEEEEERRVPESGRKVTDDNDVLVSERAACFQRGEAARRAALPIGRLPLRRIGGLVQLPMTSLRDVVEAALCSDEASGICAQAGDHSACVNKLVLRKIEIF